MIRFSRNLSLSSRECTLWVAIPRSFLLFLSYIRDYKLIQAIIKDYTINAVRVTGLEPVRHMDQGF